MLLGIIAVLGTTAFAAYSLGMVTILATISILLKRRQRVKIPAALWIIISCYAIGSFWTPYPGNPVYLCCSIIAAYLSYHLLPHRKFSHGVAAVCWLQVGVMIYQYVFANMVRVTGLSDNASVIGIAGVFGLPLLPVAVMSGLSLSRTAILGAIVGSLFSNRRYKLAVLVLGSISIVVGIIVTPNRYSNIDRLNYDVDLRVATLNGTSQEFIAPDAVEVVEWSWKGFGFGNYRHVTGRAQPHNVFIRSWYELGIFSIPMFAALMWLWWSWGRDWRLLAICLTVGLFTDELLGSVAGVYMLLIYAIIHRPTKPLVQRN